MLPHCCVVFPFVIFCIVGRICLRVEFFISVINKSRFVNYYYHHHHTKSRSGCINMHDHDEEDDCTPAELPPAKTVPRVSVFIMAEVASSPSTPPFVANKPGSSSSPKNFFSSCCKNPSGKISHASHARNTAKTCSFRDCAVSRPTSALAYFSWRLWKIAGSERWILRARDSSKSEQQQHQQQKIASHRHRRHELSGVTSTHTISLFVGLTRFCMTTHFSRAHSNCAEYQTKRKAAKSSSELASRPMSTNRRGSVQSE